MTRFRIIAPLMLSLLFSACGSNGVTFNLQVDIVPGMDRQELLAASVRMMERRVQAVEQQEGWQNTLEDIDVTNAGDGAVMTVTLNESGVGPLLVEDVTRPFSFEFMVQVPQEEADVVVAETQGYKRTGLETSHVQMLRSQAAGDAAEVLVEFTAEGKTKKGEIFREHIGETMGLFVRGLPIYQFVVEQGDVSGDAFVIKVPQAGLAAVFTDDVNTGLHITFTSVQ
jgi:hypothetical protein